MPIWSLDSKPPKCDQCVIATKFNNNSNELLTRMVDKCDDAKKKELFQHMFGNKIELRFSIFTQQVPILVLCSSLGR